ncbi:MAG: hypothetical protein ACOCRO_01020 [Halanaerobiales bacterium]
MNNKVACLDADVIIKMSQGNNDLLEIVASVFDRCYLHQCREYQLLYIR